MPTTHLNRADDAAFDSVYPSGIQRLSKRFWTPVAIARRAVALFQGAGARRVLDVGAGVGKFVLAAAAAAPDLEIVGIEQRAHLVEVARRACSCLGLANASFEVADVTGVAWQTFDGLYFFNPLAENLFARGDRIDEHVVLTRERFVRDVLSVEAALRSARLGTSVVTYHGTSTRMPTCYELETVERAGSDWLRLWTKRHEQDDGSCFIEVGDSIIRCPADEAARLVC